jgi:hypothetical protein
MLGRRPPSKKRTKAERREAAQEADAVYRAKQRSAGVPETREFADVLAYEVLRSNKGDTAEAIVKRACERMLAVLDDKTGRPKWTIDGVKFRYQYCSRQMEFARELEKSAPSQ